jgi:hypothetical protein
MRIQVVVRTFLFLGLFALAPASAQTYHWDSYDPPVVSWGPDRLDFFVICADGHLWHTAFNGVAWQTAWDDRGGPEAPLIPGAVSVVSWGPNRIDVFMGGGDYKDVWHTAWNGSRWQPWDDRGHPGSAVDSVWTLSAVSWGPNRLDVFTGGGDGHLWQLTWNGSSWLPWTDRGSPAGVGVGDFRAVSWGPNRIDVFATSGWATSETVWHTAWNGSSWQGWDSRGAPPNGGTGPVVPVSWGAGRLDLFTFSPSATNSVHCWHDSWNGSSWETTWDDRGGQPGATGFFVGEGDGPPSPRAVSWGDNRLDVFVLSDGVWHTAWNGSNWQPWEDFGGPPGGAGAVWVTSWGKERLDIFTQSLGHIWQLTWNGSTWLPWADRGMPPVPAI